jgi:Tfp pilus assembly protein PilO
MKKNNSGLMAALTFLIVVASFIFTWRFVIPDYTSKKQAIAQTDLEITNEQAKFDSLNTTKASLNQLGDLVNQMLVAVPSDKDAPNLITELEAIASKHNTTIPSINIVDSASAAGTASSSSSPVTISFAVCGAFDDMHTLVSALESDLRFMNIQNITLTQQAAGSAGDTSSCSGKLSLSLQLQAFKRIEVAPTSPDTTGTVPGV